MPLKCRQLEFIALNPDVTDGTVSQTICVSGYTKSVRPANSYTHEVKAKLLRGRRNRCIKKWEAYAAKYGVDDSMRYERRKSLSASKAFAG
jgi:hypothetical protein